MSYSYEEQAEHVLHNASRASVDDRLNWLLCSQKTQPVACLYWS